MLGCSSNSIISKPLPRGAAPGKAQGITYFLPLGKVHIVAVRTESYVTNYLLNPEQVGEKKWVMNFLSKVVLTTNIVGNTSSLSNFYKETLPPSITFSNFQTTGNQFAPSVSTQAYSSIVSSTNVTSTTNTAAGTNQATMVVSNGVSTVTGTNPPGPITTAAATTVLNGPAIIYPTNSVYSNYTKTTITAEQPGVTTNYFYNVTITTDYEADRSNLFVLKPKLDAWHDDNVTLTIDGNGLLSTLCTSNVDQSGNVVVALAQAAAQAFTLASGVPVAPEVEREKETRTFPRLIDISFDPFVSESLREAEAELRQAGLTIANAEAFSKEREYYTNENKLPKERAGGIFYRPPVPYEVRIRDSMSNVVSRTVLLPNKSPILHLAFKKTGLVSRVTQVVMTNGFIYSYAVSKPSTALAAAELPVTILSSVTAPVTNLLQMRFNLGAARSAATAAALANQGAAISNAILQQQLITLQLSNKAAMMQLSNAAAANH